MKTYSTDDITDDQVAMADRPGMGIVLRRRRSRALLGGAGNIRNRQIVGFGDSRTALIRGFTNTASTFGFTDLNNSYMQWAQAISGQRTQFTADGNFGVNGATTAGMVTGLTSPAWAVNSLGVYTPVTHPAGIVVVWGGTNDFGGGLTLLSAQTNMLQILAALSHKTVILLNEIPRGVNDAGASQNALSGTNLTNFVAYHNWLNAISMPNVYVVDVWQDFIDAGSGSNFTNLQGTLYDGLHPNVYGSKLIGNRVSAAIQSIVSAFDMANLVSDNTDIYNASTNPFGCLNANPLLPTGLTGGSKTGSGTFAGTFCTGWTINGNAGAAPLTITGTQDVGPDSFAEQTIAWTGTTGGSTAGLTFSGGSINARVTKGDKLFVAGVLAFDASTFAGVSNIAITCSEGSGSNPTSVIAQLLTTSQALTANIGSIRLPFCTTLIDTNRNGGSLVSTNMQLNITLAASTAVAGSVSISRFGIRKAQNAPYALNLTC